jgi:hypothetical protein
VGKGEKRPRHIKWKIVITPAALKMIKSISDSRIRGQIAGVIDRLAEDPDKQVYEPQDSDTELFIK